MLCPMGVKDMAHGLDMVQGAKLSGPRCWPWVDPPDWPICKAQDILHAIHSARGPFPCHSSGLVGPDEFDTPALYLLNARKKFFSWCFLLPIKQTYFQSY